MLIRTENLSKTYQLDGIAVPALAEINLNIAEGEFISIMGPSGCGKSTLMHLLGCLDTPTEGSYWLGGELIDRRANLPKIRREKIGFVFQTFNLLPRLSAIVNVEVPMVYCGIKPKQRRQRSSELLNLVGLSNRVNHLPNQLSGGERQRVAIARALANEPQIILADEPTGNLDSRSGEDILKLLEKLNRENKVTLIIVTHDEKVAGRAGRIVRMLDGRIV